MAKKKKKDSKILSLSRKELLSSPQSYRSLFFGVATVIILFLIGFGITRLFLGNPNPEISEEAVSTESIEQALNNQGDYTVKEGDTLWSIAEVKYGSGFEWYRIAEANNISDRWNLEAGTQLIVPGLEEVSQGNEEVNPSSAPSVTPTIATQTVEKIEPVTTETLTGDSYTVKEGDYLWDIAVRAYGDGYRWVDISQANDIKNPDIIYAGTNLKLPR